MWSLEGLYQKLDSNPNCDVNMIISRFGTSYNEDMNRNFTEAFNYFTKEGKKCIPVTKGTDFSSYDILFYMTPYQFFYKNINVKNIQLKTLTCYVAYSFTLSNKIQKLFLPLYYLSWQFFADSLFYKKVIETHSHVYSGNAVYCGYPRMDTFFSVPSTTKNNTNKKVIIFAPHHSISTKGAIKFSTFNKNYKFMLEIAKKYADTTYWVYKPHPLLAEHSIQAGIFKNHNEYIQYEQSWSNLNNAEVSSQSTYFDIFKKSSAMITDSVSFLAEYQYVGNPLLLLTRKEACYNSFGNAITDVLYKCKGEDLSSIEEFVQMIISNKDPMQEKRKKFFDKNLNYYKHNSLLANDYIYSLLQQNFRIEQK